MWRNYKFDLVKSVGGWCIGVICPNTRDNIDPESAILTTRTYSNISMMAEFMRLYREPLLRKALITGSKRKFLMM